MFENSLMESAAVSAPQSRWPAVFSVTLQLAFAAALLSIPLLHPATLTMLPRAVTLAVPPLPRPPIVIPQVMPVVQAAMVSAASALAAPGIERLNQPLIHAQPAAALSDAPPVLNPSLPFGEASGSSDALRNVMPGGGGAVTSAIATTGTGNGTRGTASKPAAISSGVSAGLLLEAIRPEYPAIARAARQSGVVRVTATITAAGRVENVRAVSGPAMLQLAATQAVRAARYRPYMLNGQPTAVEATFDINFRLNE
ncbi:MAG: energy transducer TonB [Acidobacteriaceae bacterium]|nr:energy transducer TonB [Acidobacteriaceae bacterium]